MKKTEDYLQEWTGGITINDKYDRRIERFSVEDMLDFSDFMLKQKIKLPRIFDNCRKLIRRCFLQ